MLNLLLNSKTKTITLSAALVGFSSTISALLGLLRDRLLAGQFGAGAELDIYFAAFRIPNFVYGVLITGGLVAAFLPVFSETFEKNEQEGWELASNLLNFLILALAGLAFLLFIFAPWIMRAIAPGFDSSQMQQTVNLTRVMLLSPILLGVSSLFSGVLKYFDRFVSYALAPVLYNLGIIFGILFLVPVFDLMGLAYGVVLGALLHLLIQIPPAKKIGFDYGPILDFSSEKLKRIIKLIIPRMIGQASHQLNLVIITALATTLIPGSLSIFNFADHLQAFPVRVIGVSFAVAAFPRFSKNWTNGERKELLDSFSRTFRHILFAIIPLSFLIFILRGQIVRLVLGTGRFDWTDTRLTAAALGIFSIALFAKALVHLLIRVYFSFQDTKTPVKVAIGVMLVNISLAFLFAFLLGRDTFLRKTLIYILRLESLEHIRVLALPLAFLFSDLLHFGVLFKGLKNKLGNLRGDEIFSSTVRILGASIVMTIAAFYGLRAALSFVVLETFWGVFFQAAFTTVVAFVVYLLAAYVFDCSELFTLTKSFLLTDEN